MRPSDVALIFAVVAVALCAAQSPSTTSPTTANATSTVATTGAPTATVTSTASAAPTTQTAAPGATNAPPTTSAPSWSYDTVNTWATLFPQQCGGSEQSPININTTTARYSPLLRALRFNDGCSLFPGDILNVTNTGTMIVATFAPPVQLEQLMCHVTDGVDGNVYTLQEIRFHRTSEHKFDNEFFGLEAQIVFRTTAATVADKFLVVAVPMTNGEAPGAALAELILGAGLMPAQVGATNSTSVTSAHFLAAKTRATASGNPPSIATSLSMLGDLITSVAPAEYFFYRGSITTPPCTQGTRWFVMASATYVSRATTSALERLLIAQQPSYAALGGNIRPVQPLNGRIVQVFRAIAPPTAAPSSDTPAPSDNGTATQAPIAEPAKKKLSAGSIVVISLISIFALGLIGYGIWWCVENRDMSNFQDMLKGAREGVTKLKDRATKSGSAADKPVSYDAEMRKK